MTIERSINGRTYSAREHGKRKNGSREPKYIADGLEQPVEKISGEALYLGKRRTMRVTIHAAESWWYIDDKNLFDSLSKLEPNNVPS